MRTGWKAGVFIGFLAERGNLPLVLFRRTASSNLLVLGVGHGSWIRSICLSERAYPWRITRSWSKKLGYFGIFVSSVQGIASPLCMYGTIPIAASFSRSGVRGAWLAAFMMSSILLSPQLILYSASLGRAVLIVRILSCFLCGMMAGLCIRSLYKEKPFLISGKL